MVMAKLHIICGNCGSNYLFNYELQIPREEEKHNDNMQDDVWIKCRNCATVHVLSDNAKLFKPNQ